MIDIALFSSKLKRYREGHFHLRQNIFSEMINCSEQTISQLENRKRLPSINLLLKVATNTSIPMTCFLTDKTPMSIENAELYTYLESLPEEMLKSMCNMLEAMIFDQQENNK